MTYSGKDTESSWSDFLTSASLARASSLGTQRFHTISTAGQTFTPPYPSAASQLPPTVFHMGSLCNYSVRIIPAVPKTCIHMTSIHLLLSEYIEYYSFNTLFPFLKCVPCFGALPISESDPTAVLFRELRSSEFLQIFLSEVCVHILLCST